MRKNILILLIIAAAALMLTACFGGGGNAAKRANDANKKLQTQIYQIKHFIEFRNYNWRQKISDEPSTILWCTFFPLDAQPFTVPVAGKLTSSNKRPYRGTNTADNGTPGTEVAGPDSMFGSSSEYRYGFGPLGQADYIDFTDLPSTCTTIPKVWQNQTDIISKTSTTLQSISNAASAAIKAGDAKKAQAILGQADQQVSK